MTTVTKLVNGIPTQVEVVDGVQIIKTQSSHGFSVLDSIYFNGTIWAKAQANSEATLPQFVITSIADTNNFEAYQFGEIEITGHGKTVDEHYFQSEATAGVSTTTEPTVGFSSPTFYVVDANTVIINIYRPHEANVLANKTLDNLGTTAVNADINPAIGSTDTLNLGSSTKRWNDFRSKQSFINNMFITTSTSTNKGILTFSTDSVELSANAAATNVKLLATADVILDPTGDIDASTNKIKNVVDPTLDQDAATKKYVDDNSGGGGTSITKLQVAHGLNVLDSIYHNGTIWVKAQSDSDLTLAQCVVTNKIDDDNFVAFQFGEVTITAHGKTVGQYYFNSNTVAGGSTTTEPVTGYSSPIFYVEDANTVIVNVYRPHGVDSLVATMDSLDDVSAAAPSNGDALIYNSSTGDWESSNQVTSNGTGITNLQTLSGSPGATNHGTFTGSTIPDNLGTKAALQSLETAAEAAPNPNILINGDMRVNQRDILPKFSNAVVNGDYYLDRWKSLDTVGASCYEITTTQPSELSGSSSLKYVCSTGGTGHIGAEQPIEDFSLYSGKTVTFSTYIRGSVSGGYVKIRIYDGSTYYESENAIAGTTFNKLQIVATLPSSITELKVQVITINAGADVPLVANNYIEFTGAKLELGSTATDFVADSYADSLRKCQRYGVQMPSEQRHSYVFNSNNTIKSFITLPVPLRSGATPTVENLTALSSGASFLGYDPTTWHTFTTHTTTVVEDSGACAVVLHLVFTGGGGTTSKSWGTLITSFFIEAEL